MAYESKWWNMRSGELVNSGTISRESSDSVFSFFSRRDWKSREIFLSLLAMFATSLAITGLVIMLGENWMKWGGGVRVALGILPMIAGYGIFYYAFNNRSDSKFLMEAACIFCMQMVGFSLLLLATHFETLAEPKLLIIWMLMSLPVIYMSGSSFGAIQYLALVYSWLYTKTTSSMVLFFMMMRGDYSGLLTGTGVSADAGVWGWLLILLILPHFFDHFDRPSFNTRKTVLGYYGVYYVVVCSTMMFVGHSFLGMAFLMVCIYMLGKDYSSDGAFWWNRPLQTLVILAFVIISFVLSFKESHGDLLRWQGYNENAISSSAGWFAWVINYIVLFGLAAGAVVSVLNDMKGDRKANLYIVAFPLIAILAIILDKLTESDNDFKIGAMLFTVYVLLMGLDYMMKGMKTKNYVSVAIGLVILLIMINLKFFYHLRDIVDDAELIDKVVGLFLIMQAGAITWLSLAFYKKADNAQ